MHAVHIKCLNYVDFYIFFLATATKYHAIYINFSASARFSTHTGCLAIARRGQVISPARYWQYNLIKFTPQKLTWH